MNIDVHKVASLARIRLTDDESSELGSQLSTILSYIDTLQQVDTAGVVATAHPHDAAMPLRPDVVTNANRRDALLHNAPDIDSGLFVVPKVVE